MSVFCQITPSLTGKLRRERRRVYLDCGVPRVLGHRKVCFMFLGGLEQFRLWTDGTPEERPKL